MSKKLKIILIVAASVLVVAVLGLIVLEDALKRRYTISNETDTNITHLQVFFETAEDGVELQTIFEGELKAGEEVSGKFERIGFGDIAGDIGVVVTFEGQEECYDYDGLITGVFDGRINLRFTKDEDGDLGAYLKAGFGLFNDPGDIELDNVRLYFDPEDEIDWEDLGLDEDWDEDEELDEDWDEE